MREIKFRAWHKEKKAFIAGFNMVNFHSYFNAGLEPSIHRYDREWKLSEIELLQYTGLKDKNGKEIYEGDIFGTEALRAVVERKEDGAYVLRFFDARIKTISILDHKISKSTIVGNIYQHSDLLK
jgi:hypothetical protein